MGSDSLIEFMCVNVTDGDRQSIRRVVWLRRGAEFQQRANHLLDLDLFGAAISGHRALHFQRRVFENGQIRFSSGKHRYTADMAQL